MLDDASSPPPSASPAAETPSAGGSRLSASVDWLKGRADTSLGRLTLLWFKRYFEASRNSGAAASAYITLSAVPTALVIAAAFRQAKGDENAFAERLIDHMRLDGATASLVRDVFGSSANNLLAASVTVLISFLFWGLGVGQLYQSLYARAWRVRAGTVADQIRFTVWFFVLSAFLAAFILSASAFRAAGWAALLVAWFAGSMIFWLWTPAYLLHRQVSLRSLMPGAILSTFVVGGTIATAPLWIAPTLNQNANAFGDFGVVVAIFAYILIVVTISMVCAVFSPVWFEWRQGENERTG
jgi:membrane protein